jgi:hypothetical protein
LNEKTRRDRWSNGASLELRPEYLQSIFIAQTPDGGWPDEFFIITTCNPETPGDRSSGDRAHLRLRKTLSRLGCWKHRVDSASPDWKHREIGYAVAKIEPSKAAELGRLFGQNAIFAVEKDVAWVVGCARGTRQHLGRFSQRLREPGHEPKYRIYVIRLDDSVFTVKRFREANPNVRSGTPCYYVGMTGLKPEERFANHKAGIKASRLVKDYGLHLARKKFERIPLLSRADAQIMEVTYAANLRSQGYAIWQR